MPYDIELMSVGVDLYPTLAASAALLNGIQQEFRFRLTTQAQRQPALSFVRSEYKTADIWGFLRDQRITFGGNRPYVIAFVNTPLQSSQFANLFGSHEGSEGLAVVTLYTSTQYVKEARRYCCYYLTRYCLSFVNPLIKAHNDQARKNCYFHQKIYKPDIRASMDSGWICNEDQDKLDHPPEGGAAKQLSSDERDALRKMREMVSGDYPYAIVMKGGGVKGLAFAAALCELEKYFYFDRHVGASAGAIAAVLLAAGYTPTELTDLLSKKNFRDFMDAAPWKVPINLVLKRGCFPGEHFRGWISELLQKKIAHLSDILMSNLNGAVIYASRGGTGTVTFDSNGAHKDTAAAFATRCSMSIPLFFVPAQIEGCRVYDGGLRNNFPATRFLNDYPGTPFIALYLGGKVAGNKRWMGSELLDIWIDGEERTFVDGHAGDVVVIDPSPVGTVDFRLLPLEKEFLLKAGRAAALTFLLSRNLDDGPDAGTVENANAEAEKCRHAVRRLRKRRRIIRIVVGISLILLIYQFGAVGLHWCLEGLHALRKVIF